MTPKRKRSTPDPPDHELAWLALELNLTTLPEAMPNLLERAERESMSYTDFALSLLRTEWHAEQRLAKELGKIPTARVAA